MPSSAFGSSPISAIRRTVSRELKPASTKTRVPLATKSTAFPVEPLPSTVSFISLKKPQRHRDAEKFKQKEGTYVCRFANLFHQKIPNCLCVSVPLWQFQISKRE